MPATSRAQPQAAIERVSWLAGCWSGRTGDSVFEERWAPLRGGTMVSAGRTIRGERTVSVELIILRARGDTLAYEAHPVGQETATFLAPPATPDSSGSVIAFENRAHDFPQRIIYRRRGADSLLARIEGPGRTGGWRGIDFPMRRVPCTEGGAP